MTANSPGTPAPAHAAQSGRSPRRRSARVNEEYPPSQPSPVTSSNSAVAHRCGSSASRIRQYSANLPNRSGHRVHRTTRRRPAEVFAAEEAPRLLTAPVFGYEIPVYATAKVHRDHHIEVARSLYSIPGNLIGKHVDVRADSRLVRVWHRGQLWTITELPEVERVAIT